MNPFESDLRSMARSPFDDSFSSSVAQTLSEKANVEELLAARTLNSASRDIFKIIKEEEEQEAQLSSSPQKNAIPEPLIPTSSAAMVTTNVTTSQARNPPQVSVTVGGVVNPMYISASAPSFCFELRLSEPPFWWVSTTTEHIQSTQSLYVGL